MTSNTDREFVIANPDVAAVFASYDDDARAELLHLRLLILDTADTTAGVGTIEEVLKWGQPSYLTAQSRSGSTIRIAPTSPGSEHDYAMYFICHTNLIDTFRSLFGDALEYDGNRALLFTLGAQPPNEEVRACIALALTYHLTHR